jgi:transcriptional regulator with XRE-family HTH domain
MGVGQNIRALRERQGYGQAEFARIVGMPVNTLWRIEKFDRKPRGETLRKIAGVLGVTPAVLQGLPE